MNDVTLLHVCIIIRHGRVLAHALLSRTENVQERLYKNLRTWVGIEPTPSYLRCDALPVELPSPLGARWWGVEYTSVVSWCPLHLRNKVLIREPCSLDI